VINYTNPMSVCTRTLTKVEPGLKVFGCCHEVFGTQEILAEVAQETFSLAAPPSRDEIHVNVLGINHFTWIDRATYQGHDLLALLKQHLEKPGIMRSYTREEVEARRNWFFDSRQVKFSLFKRFGILPAAGDRHLVEFVPGFTRSPDELFRWGVIRTPVSYRIQVWQQSSSIALDYIEGRRSIEVHPSDEEAIRQLRGILGLEDFVTNVNLENSGQISNLPTGSVVETNAIFRMGEVRPISAGALPPGVQAQVIRHINNQEMIIDAAITRDKDLAFQAIFNDPTTQLPIDQAWAMFNEIGVPAGFR
jgi:alpha-galactosidase/6-phospho-beta-glucosidase family protein